MTFSIFWHITTECSNNCKHCFVHDKKTYEAEKRNVLSLNDMFKVLDRIDEFEKKYSVKIKTFNITGGDPFLRKDWYDLFSEIRKRKKLIKIAGNPETLTENVIKKLHKLNIDYFQMSLDGLEKTHDSFRSKGSFQRTLDKINLLDQNGIKPIIRFTLFPYNSKDLLPLMRFIAKKTKVKQFSFVPGCFSGNAENLKNQFSMLELKKIIKECIKEKKELLKENNSLEIKVPSLFKTFIDFENNLFHPNIPKSIPVIEGCALGWDLPTILADGTLVPCSLYRKPIGKLPEQSLDDVFFNNEFLKKARRAKYFLGCKKCDLYYMCRGCPAYTNSISKDPFGKKTLCFKDHLNRKMDNSLENIKEPPLTTTMKEEVEFVLRQTNFLSNTGKKAVKNNDFKNTFVKLYKNNENRKLFLSNPHNFIKTHNLSLDNDLITWLNDYFKDKKETSSQYSDSFIESLLKLTVS